jgi:predicted phosphodiesterase
MPDIVAMQLDGPSCGLVISDLHIPYHDKTAVQCVLNESKRRELDWILLGGDMLDVYALSSWETDPRERDFKSEVRKMRVFLSILRDTWPEIPIIYKWGNHEERYVRYMECKAQELLDVDDFKLSKVLRCNTLDIQTVEERQIVKLGKLNFIHGHEYKFAIGNPVNPARGLFLRGKVNAFCGHFHQTSQHSENTMNDDWISCWSIGCLSDLHPRWMPLNKWNHGFAFIELDKVGAFSIENLRIIDGTVWR